MPTISENFYTFIDDFKNYKQLAKKKYKEENFKYIVNRIGKAVFTGDKPVVVFGDKDPDGIFSSLIIGSFIRFLMVAYRPDDYKEKRIGVDIQYSDRERDGFGLSYDHYKTLSEEYSLIITTDNGTSSGFHSKEITNLCVIDHHPVNEGEELPDVPYILNPNTYRDDDLEYSTSGGMVAYDVVSVMDKMLLSSNKHYQEWLSDKENYQRHTLFMTRLKEYSAFTLVSDMATLDRNNRRFVLEAFSTIPHSPNYLYSLFNGEFTQNALSFNIIPKINIDRMGELHTINPSTGVPYIQDFIDPDSLNGFNQAKRFILEVDKRRKKMVNDISQELNLLRVNDVNIVLIDNPMVKSGLLGLIANRILQKSGIPTMVGLKTPNSNRIAFSGRGSGVKQILAKVLDTSGGHNDASGGSLQLKEGESAEDGLHRVIDKLKDLTSLPQPPKIKVAHSPDDTLSFKELLDCSREYHRVLEGVEASQTVCMAVFKPNIISYFTFASGSWGKLKIGDDSNSFERREMLLNFDEFPIEKLKNSEVFVFKMIANGDISIEHLFASKEEYLQSVVQLPESIDYALKGGINLYTHKEEEKPYLTEKKALCFTSKEDLQSTFQLEERFKHIYFTPREKVNEMLLEDISYEGKPLFIVNSYTDNSYRHPLGGDERILEVFSAITPTLKMTPQREAEVSRELLMLLSHKVTTEPFTDIIIEEEIFSEDNLSLSKSIQTPLINSMGKISVFLESSYPQRIEELTKKDMITQAKESEESKKEEQSKPQQHSQSKANIPKVKV